MSKIPKEIIEEVTKKVFEPYQEGRLFENECLGNRQHHMGKTELAIKALQEHYVLVPKDKVIILTHDAKPEVGDFITYKAGGEQVCKFLRKGMNDKLYGKIIYRNGKSVIQEPEQKEKECTSNAMIRMRDGTTKRVFCEHMGSANVLLLDTPTLLKF